MQVSIILLNFNSSNLTSSCLDSLYKIYNKEFKENIFETIVVDNFSESDELKKLMQEIQKKDYKNLLLVENKENFGFGKGCNIGAKKAKGKYLFFLNNDTSVEDRGIFEMAKFLDQHPEVSILGGQLKYQNGQKQPSTGKFYNLRRAFFLLLGLQKIGAIDKSPKNISEVDWVKGALLMIRKNIFEELGGFDEKIFMYMEDMELCYRARKRGYKTYFYPDISVIHQDQGSSNRSFAIIQIYKGLLYFYKKHKSNVEYIIVKIALYTKAIVAIFIGYLTRNKYLVSTYKEAIKF